MRRVKLWVWLAGLTVVSGAVYLALLWLRKEAPLTEFYYERAGPAETDYPLILSGVTTLFSSIGTISAVWLNWRAERRANREFAQKFAELEAKPKTRKRRPSRAT